MTNFTRPGAILGIIGGGILAYRLALAGRKLGLHVVILALDQGDIAFDVADMRIVGRPNDPAALKQLAETATVITFTDENIDGEILKSVTQPGQLPSGVQILDVTQDRYLEKVFLEDQNMNILPYAQVVAPTDIAKAMEDVGFPAILKPIQKSIGVDQQLKLERPADVKQAEQLLQQRPYVLEAWLTAPLEFSVMVAKRGDTVSVLPVVQNYFTRHLLKASVVPAAGGEAVAQEIRRIANVIAEHLDYTGVFGIELFMTSSMTLYVKRLFPGPQMNGHVLEATTDISPYEMHLRAILGWPLPAVHVTTDGALLLLRPEDRAEALTQIQIKPDWRFRFYPEGGPLIGEFAVTGELPAITQQINATEHFHVGPQGEDA